MRKIFASRLIIILILICSCKKNTIPNSPYGSWIFKGVTYKAASCLSGRIYLLTASDNSDNDNQTANKLTVDFRSY
jgi:hypothetical protein